VCAMPKTFHPFFLALLLAAPSVHAQVTLSLEGSLALKQGNVLYEEYFLVSLLGLGKRSQEKLGTKEGPSEFLGLGGAYALSRLEGTTAEDKGEAWLRFEADPRVLFEKKVRYLHFSLWAFVETRLGRDRVLGMEEAANHFAGLGLSVKPLGGAWTFTLEQGLGQRSEKLSTGDFSAYLAGYGSAVNSFGAEGTLRLVLSTFAYVEEGPGLPITENWTLRQTSTLEVPIEGAFALTVTHQLDHRNRPVAGFRPTDQSLRTGLKIHL